MAPRPAGPVELVLTDVDGTLVTDDKVLTPRAVEAVQALHDAGVHVAVTSGRPPRGMAMLVEPLSLDPPISAFNGGMVVDPAMTVLTQRALPDPVVPQVVDLMQRQGLAVWAYRGADWLVLDPEAPHVAREAFTVQFEPVVVDSFAGLARFGIDPARVVTIGDGFNDVLMFRRSGTSIAMGQADPKVTQAATYVTTGNDDEGFGRAVETHVLPRVRS